MNYKEATEYVESLQPYGCVPGLDSISCLCAHLGNPQDKLKFVHIAGTNGKGSVLAYISTILTAAGYRVGRYISPAVSDYREHFQIDGRMISKQAFCKYLEPVKEAAERMVSDGRPHPTPFEIETATAFLYFQDKKCDIVALETGMGGELDATNIIKTPLCAVLTSISMDHMAQLGNSLKEIASQKAGIIKEGVCVVSARQDPEAAEVIKQRAELLHCDLRIADEGKIFNLKFFKSALTKRVPSGEALPGQRFSYGSHKDLEISLLGKYQTQNAIVAIEAVEALKDAGFKISEQQLKRGLSGTRWRGRFEIIGKDPLFIADGAHNEDAALKLAESIRFYFPDKKIIYIMGALRDKDYDKVISATHMLAKQIITVTPPGNMSWPRR